MSVEEMRERAKRVVAERMNILPEGLLDKIARADAVMSEIDQLVRRAQSTTVGRNIPAIPFHELADLLFAVKRYREGAAVRDPRNGRVVARAHRKSPLA